MVIACSLIPDVYMKERQQSECSACVYESLIWCSCSPSHTMLMVSSATTLQCLQAVLVISNDNVYSTLQ